MLAVETKKALLLGCGHDRRRRIRSRNEPEFYGEDWELTTVDINPNCGADILHDLERLPLPFGDEEFDEIGCFDVLEHFGSQGDWRGWFDWMDDVHRILKPGGTFSAIVPIGRGALCDPGHTRFFHQNYFGFLTKDFTEDNRAKNTAATDYTWYIKRWWKLEYGEENGDVLGVQMRKV